MNAKELKRENLIEELVKRGWKQSPLRKPYQSELMRDIISILEEYSKVDALIEKKKLCTSCGLKFYKPIK